MEVANNIEQLTDEQLEAAYLFRQKQKKEKADQERVAYEVMRHELVEKLASQAISLERVMSNFHAEASKEMDAFYDLMKTYGDVRGNSKGGFSIENRDDTYRVRRSFRQLGDFDEKADMAEELIRSFFERTLKSSDPNAFEMLMDLLERKKGKMEYSRVLKILSFRDRYSDPDWLKACDLLAESYKNTGSKHYLEFEVKVDGEWRRVNTNLSSL